MGLTSDLASSGAAPAKTGSTYIVPDASRITVEGARVNLSTAWCCLFVVAIGSVRCPFTVAERGATRELIATDSDPTSARTYAYRNGELLMVHRPQLGGSLGAWQGPWHELLIERSGPRPSVEDVTRILDSFQFTDSPDGMILRPRSPWRTVFEPFAVFKEIPGIGDLRIQRPHESEVTPPAWAGTRGQHGEIWRHPMNEGARGRARSSTLVFATPTAVAQLIPGPQGTHTADEDAALAVLQQLDITWTAA